MAAKTSGRPKTGAPKYHRLTVGNRSIIWALKREGKSQGHIARTLGVHKSTVDVKGYLPTSSEIVTRVGNHACAFGLTHGGRGLSAPHWALYAYCSKRLQMIGKKPICNSCNVIVISDHDISFSCAILYHIADMPSMANVADSDFPM